MEYKYIIIGIIGVLALNLIILFIIQRISRDKNLDNYLRKSN